MATRRMFSRDLFNEDGFLTLSHGAIVAYVYLSLNADDDGFVTSPVMITRSTGTTEKDIEELIGKGYLIDFGNGILLIRHWRVHNYLRSDRYHETIHLFEKSKIYEDESKVYQLRISGIPLVDAEKISIDKRSIDEYSLDEDKSEQYSTDKDNTDDTSCRLSTNGIPMVDRAGNIREFDGDF